MVKAGNSGDHVIWLGVIWEHDHGSCYIDGDYTEEDTPLLGLPRPTRGSLA